MRVAIFSIFADILQSYCDLSILGRAQASRYLDLSCVDIREFAVDRRGTVDDSPFGGGAGMVMMAPPIFEAVESSGAPRPVYLLAPWGRQFDHRMASELSKLEGFSLICGRYEGVDARVEDHLIDGAISLGDFVLAGGELAALAVLEATVRLLPGVLGNALSLVEESFAYGTLEYPQYTRPASYRGYSVPDVLLTGNHKEILEWRRQQAYERTRKFRSDLLES